MSKQKFYLTTPIYYVNARPHIGHAYTTIAADVIARRQRLLLGNENVFFLTGTDEHGQKVQRSAAAAGIPPQQFADQVSASFRNLWKRMGITNDDYIRTTEDRHRKGVQKLWKLIEKHGFIYLSIYTGQYSVGEEMFVEGPPGVLGPDGKPTETVTEKNYFFKLSEFQKSLLDFYEANPDFISPAGVRNEVLSFVRGNVNEVLNERIRVLQEQEIETGSIDSPQSGDAGNLFVPAGRAWAVEAEFGCLQDETIALTEHNDIYVPGALKDLSISRTTFDWGIPVPDNEKHVIYVWLDALANYMTAIGYGSDDPIEQEQFKKYWPANLHLVGKEITRFHCVYWPAFLLSLNPALTGKKADEVPLEVHREWAKKMLPKQVVANGWLLFEDSKMSKSRGNIVRTETILDAFGNLVYASLFPNSTHAEQDLFAADVLRYFLLREIPFGQDGSFSFDALVQRYNSDLANGYGNLVSRTLSMIAKRDGAIPENNALAHFDPNFIANDVLPYSSFRAAIENVAVDFDQLSFSSYLSKVWSLVTLVDGYMSQYAPWKLVGSDDKVDQYKADFILYSAAEGIRIITALLYPVLPYSTAKVWAQLGFEETIEQLAKDKKLDLTWGGLKPGTKLGEIAPIFPRAPKELIQLMTDMENPATPPTPSKLVDEKTTHTSAVPTDSTDPGAAPRTSALAEPNPGATVGGSHAVATERPSTPSHAEAPASGAFATSSVGSATPDTPQIAIDDFVKIDLRVAQIIVAERIPKADKLLRLEVDLGYEKRQILSGIAEWYTPEELIGRRIVVIANLAPRKMRGFESHGMLLAASAGEDGKPVLATFGEDIALGSRLK
jgi:methionyl-tRNA synthetase